jgi:CheY-like chemotaxis protein
MDDSDDNLQRTDDDARHWRDLVARLGGEIATPLTSALDRVHALATTGRIDRQSLRALREELEQARQIGMLGQQLARFGSGRLRQSHERLQLTQTFRGVLKHRARDIQARGLEVAELLRPVEVIADASLLFGLLTGLLDWTLAHARRQAEFRIEMQPGTTAAQLSVRFEHGTTATGGTSALDTLTWELVQQTARTMGLNFERIDDGPATALAIEFPRTVNEEVAGVTATELQHELAPASATKPLAGHQVLVVASRRETRAQVLAALRDTGLIIDFVPSVVEAVQFCREGLPHAVVYEAVLAGETLDRLRSELERDAPELAFIELTEEGTAFEISSFSLTRTTRVGRDAIAASLPSALAFELFKAA